MDLKDGLRVVTSSFEQTNLSVELQKIEPTGSVDILLI